MDSRATQQCNMICAPMFMQITGCHQPVQGFYWPENAIDWLRYANKTNNMRNAKCASTQTSMEWPYCSFLYCAYITCNMKLSKEGLISILQSNGF